MYNSVFAFADEIGLDQMMGMPLDTALRLAQPLASIEGDESCLAITPEYTQHFLKVYKLGKSSFTCPRI
jgi:hypothetical protein